MASNIIHCHGFDATPIRRQGSTPLECPMAKPGLRTHHRGGPIPHVGALRKPPGPNQIGPFLECSPKGQSQRRQRSPQSHLTLTLTTKEGNPPHGHPVEVTRTHQVARMLVLAAWMMAGKEEGGWDGLVLMSSSWKVKQQNLRPAWAQVGPPPWLGPNHQRSANGLPFVSPRNPELPFAGRNTANQCHQWTSNGC